MRSIVRSSLVVLVVLVAPAAALGAQGTSSSTSSAGDFSPSDGDFFRGHASSQEHRRSVFSAADFSDYGFVTDALPLGANALYWMAPQNVGTRARGRQRLWNGNGRNGNEGSSNFVVDSRPMARADDGSSQSDPSFNAPSALDVSVAPTAAAYFGCAIDATSSACESALDQPASASASPLASESSVSESLFAAASIDSETASSDVAITGDAAPAPIVTTDAPADPPKRITAPFDTTVPEPQTIMLVGTGLVALLGLTRRRHSSL